MASCSHLWVREHLFVERLFLGSGGEFLPAGDWLPEGGVCPGTGAPPSPLPSTLWLLPMYLEVVALSPPSGLSVSSEGRDGGDGDRLFFVIYLREGLWAK